MQKIVEAIKILKSGGIILIPTETVYGIAVDARNKSAIDKIYNLKKRDNSKPLQIMVKNLEEAKKLADFNIPSLKLAEENWPGALTLILNQKDGSSIASNFNQINQTIGIRIPNHPVALQLLENIDFPIAVTSANISGQQSNITYQSAKEIFEDSLGYFLDGGKSEIGISSTVIDYTDEKSPKILRKGSVKIA